MTKIGELNATIEKAETKIGVCNAIIESADLLIERGNLTAHIQLNYGGGSGQSFGDYVLMVPVESTHRKKAEAGPNYAGLFIDLLMQVVGVSRWSDLSGKAVRVRQDSVCVRELGHIVEDNWFVPQYEFRRLTRQHDSAGGALVERY